MSSKLSDKLQIGYETDTNRSIYLDTLLHTHIRGRTRSGKTLLLILIACLIIQSLRRPLIIIDQGADPAMFHLVRAACAKEKFRWYSPGLPRVPHDSDWFNPFGSVTDIGGNEAFLANFLVTSLGMDSGDVGSSSWWNRVNTAQGHTLVAELGKQEIDPAIGPTESDVLEALFAIAKRNRFKDIPEFQVAYENLYQVPRIGVGPPGQTINTADALDQCQVHYFYLPPVVLGPAMRAVAGLVLNTVLLESMTRVGLGLPFQKPIIIYDEAGANAPLLATLMPMVTKFMTLIIAHQNTSQLHDGQRDYSDAIAENAATRIYFSFSPNDTEFLKSKSHDTLKQLGSIARKDFGFSPTVTDRDYVDSVLEDNLIRDVSNTALQAFYMYDDGKGHHEPKVIKIIPGSESPEQHAALSNTPLPLGTPSNDPIEPVKTGPKAPLRKHVQSQLRALWERCQAELDWESPEDKGEAS